MKKSLKILFVTTDMDPLCKAGGLGDVSRDLPRALKRMGYDIRIIMPRHGVISEEKNGIKLINGDLKVGLLEEEIPFELKGCIAEEGIPVYFIEKHKYFGSRSRIYGYDDENKRFLFFCKAALESVKYLKEEWAPDIIHCNDWHTALIPYLVKTEYKKDKDIKNIKTLFTIHNLTFQFGTDWWVVQKKYRDDGKCDLHELVKSKKKIKHINFAKRGIMFADVINTVSERYAQEIMQENFGQDLHELLLQRFKKGEFLGIVNGIDYCEYNPQADLGLIEKYSANDFDSKYKNKLALQKKYGLKVDKNIPLLGMVTRITEQKGFDLMMEIIDPLLKMNIQLIIVGDGEQRYKNFFNKASRKTPGRLVASLNFQQKNTTQIYAATDMFLMPSRFEPCGLGQMISLRYGSVPIVRETGGLSDTIKNYNPRTGKGNGFTFKAYDPYAFFGTIVRAVETFKYEENWRKIVVNGMKESFSWDVPARKYLALYRKMLKK